LYLAERAVTDARIMSIMDRAYAKEIDFRLFDQLMDLLNF
jgi:hypothetical protein